MVVASQGRWLYGRHPAGDETQTGKPVKSFQPKKKQTLFPERRLEDERPTGRLPEELPQNA